MFGVVIPTIFKSQYLAYVLEAVKDFPHVLESDGTFAQNCNRGAAKFPHVDTLIFLNDDCIPEPGALELLAASDDPITGPICCYGDGSIQSAGIDLGLVDGLLTAWNVQDFDGTTSVPGVTGACIAIKRDVWDALEGFDEGFVNGYEDVDLCLRARHAGYWCRLEPDARVVHYESQSGAARWTHVAHNVDRLQERWRAKWPI